MFSNSSREHANSATFSRPSPPRAGDRPFTSAAEEGSGPGGVGLVSRARRSEGGEGTSGDCSRLSVCNRGML